MDSPDIQRLMALQRTAALDNRYAALFKTLNLSPDQLVRLKAYLIDRSTVRSDVMAAAQAQGINPGSDRQTMDKVVAKSEAEIEESIRATLGETAYAQYKEYERTMPQRTTVSQLEQRLSYSSTPLTKEQSTAMLAILDKTAIGTDPTMGPFITVSDAAIEQALGVLAAPQLEALHQLQQEQRAQKEIHAAMRRQFENSRQGSAGSGQPPVPPATTTRPSGG